MSEHLRCIGNAESVPLASLPLLDLSTFRAELLTQIAGGLRLACFCADAGLDAYAVLADDGEQHLHVLRTRLSDRYPALTLDCSQAHLFEREIAEQFDVRPVGHPWLKPVRGQKPWRGGDGVFAEVSDLPAVIDFYKIVGDEVHEVAVGPVHAGVIEPGHFRFQCLGEEVMHLEIALGYQHRGIEQALIGGPYPRSFKHIETIAGDTSIGHGTAYCRVLESLGGCSVSWRAELMRAMALELERLANHTGDLGAIAGDVGFLPTASFCGRIRGDWLNLSAVLCGSRLGRDFLKPGGVRWDLEATRLMDCAQRIETAWTDTADAIELLWSTPSVMARLEGTGNIKTQQAIDIGLVGVAMRACGAHRDVRQDFPWGAWCQRGYKAQTSDNETSTGDVYARARVRWLEMGESVAFLRWACTQLADCAGQAIAAPVGPLAADHLCVSLCEGWRGEILHLAITDGAGRFRRYKIVDPSFHNWFGLALALRGEQISDFPLCNKSFNLSYCGFDL